MKTILRASVMVGALLCADCTRGIGKAKLAEKTLLSSNVTIQAAVQSSRHMMLAHKTSHPDVSPISTAKDVPHENSKPADPNHLKTNEEAAHGKKGSINAPILEEKTVNKNKEHAEGVAGLINGLNALPMRGGKVNPVAARIAADVLVAHKTSHSNVAHAKVTKESPHENPMPVDAKNLKAKKEARHSNGGLTKAEILEEKQAKEDKDNVEAIAGLVNGLNKLPMRDGKVDAVAARILARRPAALVNQPAPMGPKDVEQGKRIQNVFERAETAQKSTEQAVVDAHEAAAEARQKAKAAALLAHTEKAEEAKQNAEAAAKAKQKATAAVLVSKKKPASLPYWHASALAALLVSHAPPPMDAKAVRDATQDKRIQHAFDMVDSAEKTLGQIEKDAHEVAAEAHKYANAP